MTCSKPARAASVLRVMLGALGGVMFAAGVCGAQITSDRSATLLIFPKIFADATHDATIQLNNAGNQQVQARCFYVSVSGTCSSSAAACTSNADCLPAGTCIFQQAQTEFDILLTRQQPIAWVVSKGVLPSNAPPGFNNLIPALPLPFRGELMCVETDPSGFVTSGNHLFGTATLVDTLGGDVAKFHAIGIQGNENNDGDNTLCLGGGFSSACPNGAEFNACPQSVTLDHLADGAVDVVAGSGSAVHTTLAVAPCSLDLTSQTAPTVALQFETRNQAAQGFSNGTNIVGPGEVAFASIPSLTRAVLGTDSARTQISTADGDGNGIVAVAEEMHSAGVGPVLTASQALSPHVLSDRIDQDLIVLPATPPPPAGATIFQTAGVPRAITSGPDGNLWFTETIFGPDSQQGEIGRISPAGVLTEFTALSENTQPGAITTGPDHNLWFTDDVVSQVGRISTDGMTIMEFAISTFASDITAGPDGNVWFTEPASSSIGRISVDGTMLNEFALPSADQPYGITLGPDGNLWFTAQGSDNSKVGRISSDGGSIAEFDVPLFLGDYSVPGTITLGPDGNLWIAGGNYVGRVTPTGTVTVFPASFAASAASIARIADGNLWFTDEGALGRITPAGVITAFVNLGGTELTGGPDGNIWLLQTFPAEVVRFVP